MAASHGLRSSVTNEDHRYKQEWTREVALLTLTQSLQPSRYSLFHYACVSYDTEEMNVSSIIHKRMGHPWRNRMPLLEKSTNRADASWKEDVSHKMKVMENIGAHETVHA